MRRWLVVLFLAVFISTAAFAQAPNTLTPQESKEGWVLLFDGKTLNGWENHGNVNPWKVTNGAIYTDGTPNAWLGTTEEYGDYVLRVDFRGAADVNSGVFLRAHRSEGRPANTGYELQIWDFQTQGDLTGALVRTAKANPHVKIKANEWNTFEITAKGDHMVIVMNGQKVNDVNDKKSLSGVIGFQSNSKTPIEFRNIKLRKLM